MARKKRLTTRAAPPPVAPPATNLVEVVTPPAPLAPPYPVMPVRDLDLAFPTDVTALMPAYEEGRVPGRSEARWQQLAVNWMLGRPVGDDRFQVRNGIELEPAMRHLRVVLGSFHHKHEHKMQALARLMDTWFEWLEWTAGEMAE